MAALFLIAKVLLLPDATFLIILSTNKYLETQAWEKQEGKKSRSSGPLYRQMASI